MFQMSPLWWTFLMYFFLISFLLFISMNYFFLEPKSLSKSNIISMNTLTWKW